MSEELIANTVYAVACHGEPMDEFPKGRRTTLVKGDVKARPDNGSGKGDQGIPCGELILRYRNFPKSEPLGFSNSPGRKTHSNPSAFKPPGSAPRPCTADRFFSDLPFSSRGPSSFPCPPSDRSLPGCFLGPCKGNSCRTREPSFPRVL